MSELLFSGSQNQVIVALAIQEASAVARCNQSYVGRTALQKIVYFLKRAGVPLDYRFDIYHYGPYSDPVMDDVEWLQVDEVIKDRSPDPNRYSNYAPGPQVDDLLSRHPEVVERFRPQVRRVVEALAPFRPDHLELLATLDYVRRWLQGAGDANPSKDAVLERFMQIKGNKFPRKDVEGAYDRMATEELFGGVATSRQPAGVNR